MIQTNKLKGLLVENGLSYAKVAKTLGISESTFNRRMKKGVFKTNEIEVIMKLLNLQNPNSVFFAENGETA